MADLSEIMTDLQKRLAPVNRVNKAIKRLSFDGQPYLNNLPRLTCADGFSMSVQASSTHYCLPRDSFGPYSAVEVGYPSAKVDGFMPHIDGGPETNPTDTVYGYVPIEIVAQAIADHGGLAEEQPVIK